MTYGRYEWLDGVVYCHLELCNLPDHTTWLTVTGSSRIIHILGHKGGMIEAGMFLKRNETKLKLSIRLMKNNKMHRKFNDV